MTSVSLAARGLLGVSRVDQDELEERTIEFARRIAYQPTMSSLLTKEAVNQSLDNMGFYNALNACFTLHELNHAHWEILTNGESPGAR